MSTAPAGMTQFVVKSRFGLDRDFEALGPDGQRAWFVDGKVAWSASHAGINATSLARVTAA